MKARGFLFHVVDKQTVDSAAVDDRVASAMAATVSRSSMVVVEYSSAGELVLDDGLRSRPGLSGNLYEARFRSILRSYGEGLTRCQRRPPHPRGIQYTGKIETSWGFRPLPTADPTDCWTEPLSA